MKVFPVILCGGAGTRLWPLSRSMYPKPFIGDLNGGDESLLRQTLTRLPTTDGFCDPILICNQDHRFLVREEIDKAHVTPHAVFLEPMPRNTAPALAVAALAARDADSDAIIVAMPSDHMIDDKDGFVTLVKEAVTVAQEGSFVLFGVTPDGPNEGYGYIRRGAPLAGNSGRACKVAQFVEKPDRATAISYFEAGDFFWNSGIFVLHAGDFLAELAKLAPEVLAASEAAYAERRHDLEFVRLAREAFARAPSISIDYAVMQSTDMAAMLPMPIAWSDVGSWKSLWEVAPRDEANNFSQGDVILADSQNCYVYGENALVATLGVDNLIVVQTPDACLVADRTQAENVAKIVDRLKAEGRNEHAQHVRCYRPWGFFESLSNGSRFQVKRLRVNPGAKLSLQMHHHRSEHWVVVRGTAKVTIGDSDRLVHEGESVYIIATQWHRLENPGKIPLEIIEVQIGSYLGEDDIVRADDMYQRDASDAE